MKHDRRELRAHFAFGDNWSRFAESVNESHLSHASKELVRLVGRNDLEDVRFLDLGCGSGLHSAAAARLGAKVSAVDIDPQSVRTTTELANRFGVDDRITARVASVFEMEDEVGQYDIVYSWGVLHHTGDMWEAIREASSLVKTDGGGELVLAIYRRTRFCRFWRIEKNLYSKAPRAIQLPVRLFYTALLDLARLVRGTSPWRYRLEYVSSRGMQMKTDVHDWLGGHPYESASPPEVRSFLEALGFREVESFVREESRIPWEPFGSGCDEYRFAR